MAGRKTSKRYNQITINYKTYQAHRLAWLYMTGKWPKLGIDHINRNRLDNRWLNLREADQTQNQANKSISSNNLSGLKGVLHIKNGKGKFGAQVKKNGVKYYLGTFNSAREAHEAYKRKAAELFGEYHYGGKANEK